MSKLEIAKKIIKENYEDGKYGIYNTRNLAGDSMSTLYEEDGLQIDICYGYGYFEVFGLTFREFSELFGYYEELSKEYAKARKGD